MATDEVRRPTRGELRRWMQAKEVTGIEILRRGGVEIIDPEKSTDDELHERLWAMLRFLGTRGIYFFSTDHLSDRELYRRLVRDVLTGPFKDPDALPSELLSNPHTPFNYLDLGFGTSPRSVDTWLRYYAPEEERRALLADGYPLPQRRPLPYDRDRFLPRPPSWERGTTGE